MAAEAWWVRVAVVQIAHHPAFKEVLFDPLFDEKRETSSLLPEGQKAAPEQVRERFKELRRRVRAAYAEQTRKRAEAIVRACQARGVRIVVFPEYSMPPEILVPLAGVAPDVAVVAGSHFVDREATKVYETLGGRDGKHLLNQSVSPILFGGGLRGLVSKLQLAKPEVHARMEPGKDWAPVDVPLDLPSAVAVLICLDYLSRGTEPHARLVAPKLGACRFIAAPALTPRHSLSQFLAHGKEDAQRYQHPVLFANHAAYGGSTIIVDEGNEVDLALFPEHAGLLEAGEEGVIIADINLGDGPVGPSTPYNYHKTILPLAAASLVYAGMDPEGAAWVRQLESLLDSPDESDYDKLVRITEFVQGHPPPRRQEKSARGRRLDRLVQDIEEESSLERVRALAMEIVLPEEVLSLEVLRAAMAQGAADAIQGWIDEFGFGHFGLVVSRLRDPWAKLAAVQGKWSSSGLQATLDVQKAVSGGALRQSPRALAKLVVVYETVANEHFKKETQEALTDLHEGRDERGREKLSSMLRRTEAMMAEAAKENAEPRQDLVRWAEKYKLLIALASLNLQEQDRARDGLLLIDSSALSPVDRIQLAEGLALVGEVARAGQVFPRRDDVAEKETSLWLQARQNLDLIGGTIPDQLIEDSTLYLRAAGLRLARHNLAEAARLGLRALELGKAERYALTRAMLLFVLVDALQQTIFEQPANAGPLWTPIPHGEPRERVILALEAGFSELQGAALPKSIRDTLERAELAFRVTTRDRSKYSTMLSGPHEIDEPRDEKARRRSRAFDLVMDGRIDEGLQVLPPDDHPWVRELERVELLGYGKRFDDALEAALELAEKWPDRAPIEYAAAELLTVKGKRDEAQKHAEKAFAALPGIGYRLLLAQARFNAGEAEGAFHVLKDRLEDERAEVQRAIAIAASATDRLREAEIAWRRYLGQRQDDVHAHVALAQVLYRLHKVEEAAGIAWKATLNDRDRLGKEELYACGWLQAVAGGMDVERARRIKVVLERLKRRFDNNIQAEQLRLRLVGYLGEIPEGITPIDFDALAEHGIVYKGSGKDALIEVIQRHNTILDSARSLAQLGSLPVVTAARQGNVAPALLVARILARTHEAAGYLCPPVSLTDQPPALRLMGARLLVSDLEIVLLVVLDIVELLRTALGPEGRLVLFEHVRDRLLSDAAELRIRGDRWDAPAEDRVAFEYANKVHALLAEPFVEFKKAPPVDDLPPLRENDGGWAEALFREPLKGLLAYRYAIVSEPTWWRLTAEFFVSVGLGLPEIVTSLAWPGPEDYQSVVVRVREAARRDLTLPGLLRHLLPNAAAAEGRLVKLAELGFPDALGASEILRLERRYGGLDAAQVKRILDAQEWMALKPDHLGGALARLRLAQVYGRAVFDAYSEPGLTSAERKAIVDALMGRMERIGHETLTNALDHAFMTLAATTVDHWKRAWKKTEDEGGSYRLDPESSIAILWDALASWTGEDGSRWGAHGRAFRDLWRALSRHREEGPPAALVATFLGTRPEFEQSKEEWSLVVPDMEALAILSARWKENPFGSSLVGEIIGQHVEPFLKGAVRSFGAREVMSRANIEGEARPILIRIPVEALFLRLSGPDRAQKADELAQAQGTSDGMAYHLLLQIKNSPEDPELLDAYADLAAGAVFRRVQDDP